MKNRKDDVVGAGTVLRGNFPVKGSNQPGLAVETDRKSEELRRTEEFESAARGRIGGSIAFVTKLKDTTKDPLFWDGKDA